MTDNESTEVKNYIKRLKFRRKMMGPQLDMRPKVKTITNTQRILHQSQGRRTDYYFTTGRQLDPCKVESVKHAKSPYWLPPEDQFDSYRLLVKECENERRTTELKLPAILKPNFQSRIKNDLLERLHVPTTPETASELRSQPRTILDIDPEYFSIVENRQRRNKRDRLQYLQDVRDILRIRLEIGFNRDESLLIDEHFREEQQRVDEVREKYETFVWIFNEFLAEDHIQSMELLKKARYAAYVSAQLAEEIKKAIQNMGVIKTQVFLMEDNYSLGKMCRRFLFSVSPLSWRMEHDAVHLEIQDMQADSFNGTMRSLKIHEPDRIRSSIVLAPPIPVTSLEQIVSLFVEEDEYPEAILYFEKPEQLIQIFKTLAAQSLASLLHIEQVRVPLEALLAGVEKTKKKVAEDLEFIQDQIREREEEIEWEETRLAEIQRQFEDIVEEAYKVIIGSFPDLPSLHVWVEDLYERCIAPIDSHVTIYTMMTTVEKQLESELVALDYLNAKEVQEARNFIYSSEARQMKEAQDAQRKIQEFDQLINRMHRAVEFPPPRPMPRRPTFRSKPRQPRRKPPTPPPKLTQEELDHVMFFTDQPILEKLSQFLPEAEELQDITQVVPVRVGLGKGMEIGYGKPASRLSVGADVEKITARKCAMGPIMPVKPMAKLTASAEDGSSQEAHPSESRGEMSGEASKMDVKSTHASKIEVKSAQASKTEVKSARASKMEVKSAHASRTTMKVEEGPTVELSQGAEVGYED